MIVVVFFVSLIWWYTTRSQWRQEKRAQKWLDLAFVMRLIGAVTYFLFAYYLSDGSVDAFVYDNYGSRFAEAFRNGDLSPFFDEDQYRNGKFIGANFVGYPNALFFLLTGDDPLSTYFLFSLVAFGGILWGLKAVNLSIGKGFQPIALLAMVVVPSIWFWNSTIGKDSFSFLGGGLVMYGVATKDFNKKWIFIALGVGVTYLFRPPFALILLLAVGTSIILDRGIAQWKRALLSIGGIIVLFITIQSLQSYMGLQQLEAQQVNEQLSGMYRHTQYGGGAIESKTFSPAGVLQSYIDVFARPFPWELKSIFYGLAFVETIVILILLYLIFFRLRGRYWFWKDNLFRFLIISSIVFGLAVGITEANIGIILRHRSIIHLFLIAAYILVASKAWQQKQWRKFQLRQQYLHWQPAASVNHV